MAAAAASRSRLRPPRSMSATCHRPVTMRLMSSPGARVMRSGVVMLRWGEWARRRASFDKLRMRAFLRATKIFPHPELVEGRRAVLQRCANPIVARGGEDFSLLPEMGEGAAQGGAGDLDHAGEGLVELEDEEDRAGDREGGDQSAVMTVALRGANRPKLANSTTSQNVRMTRNT